MSYERASRTIGAITLMIALFIATVMSARAAAPTAAAFDEASPDAQPGHLTITKTVHSEVQSIEAGQPFSYVVTIAHVGGDGPAHTVMNDHLPAGIHIAGRPRVREEVANVAPLAAQVRGNAVHWEGALSPGAVVKIAIPVRARLCYGERTIERINEASARQTDGTTISAQAATTIACLNRTPPIDQIEVSQIVLPDTAHGSGGGQSAEVLPGLPTIVQITAINHGAENVLLGLHGETVAAPDAQTAEEMDAVSDGAFRPLLLRAGETRVIKQRLHFPADAVPESEFVRRLRYCILHSIDERCRLGDDEHGRWANELRFFLRHRDLGDAPDSTNHFGNQMTAYSGIRAEYPTVFDPATGAARGPMHLFAHPFHLGRRVSAEVEADIGPDVDPTNNIRPPLNIANRDRADDGIRPGSLNFNHCARTTVNVGIFISPRAANYLAEHGGQGYLNLWLDGNRDGDWDDVEGCTDAQNQNHRALEHIVIDHPIPAAMGAGLHIIPVTTRIVSWPAKHEEKPAWLRVTLSDRPSNKPFNDGGVAFGDGRGHELPFWLGETEDYKLRFRDLVDGADVIVRKAGVVRQDFESEPGVVLGEIVWRVHYHNQGEQTANDVVMTDTLPASVPVDDTSLHVRTVPEIPFTRDGHTLAFDVGEVESARGGNVLIRTRFRLPFDQLKPITNVVEIHARNDADPANNNAQASVQLGLRAPVITWPANGTVCDGEVEVRGRSVPDAEVDLYVNGALETTVTANGAGRWSHPLSLGDGVYELHAIARKGGLTSPASPTILLIVDTSLPFSPLSLRLTDDEGHSRRPKDADGRTDADGWRVRLAPNTTYTVSVALCCTADDAAASVVISGVAEITLTQDLADGLYKGSFTTGDRVADPEPTLLSLSVTCDGVIYTYDGQLLIDPEGVVYHIESGQLLDGATVACMEEQPAAGGTEFTLWPAVDFGQVNPQTTQADGYFSFWTPAGTYQLAVEKDGYQAYGSWDIVVEDELVRYDVPLTPVIAEPADYVVEVSENGFNPALLTIKPGSVVEWVNVDVEPHTATGDTPVVSYPGGVGQGAWDSGLLEPGESYKFRMEKEGTFGYADHENPAATATIIVDVDAPENADGGETESVIYLPLIVR